MAARVRTHSVPIGRRNQVRGIRSALSSPRVMPAGVLLDGEAGIGKTTVFGHLLDLASTDGASILETRPAETEVKVAFGALADVVGAIPDRAIHSLPVPQQRALDAVLIRDDPDPNEPMQRTVPMAVGSAIEAMAAETPTILAVDDAQWLDRSSAEVLRYVIRRLRSPKIVVLVATRSEAGGIDPLDVRAALPNTTHEVRLGALTLGALHEIVEASLGLRLARPVLVRILDATGGNPFYALEFARALATDGRLDDPAAVVRLTAGHNELVDRRVRALSPAAARAALFVATAVERDVGSLLAATGTTTWDDFGGAAAEGAGVLEIRDGVARLTHPLLSAAIVEAAAPSERRDAHRRLANVTVDAEMQARHRAAAAVEPDEDVAAALDLAAVQAWDRGARNAAAELAELALANTPQSDDRAKQRRRLSGAAFEYEAANPGRADALLEAVLADDPTTDERREASCLLGSVRYRIESFERCVALLTEAGTRIGADDHVGRARVAIEKTYAGVFGGDLAGAVASADEALAAARSSGVDELERAAAGVASLAHLLGGRGLREDLVDIALNGPEPVHPLALPTVFPAAAALKWADEFERARAHLTQHLEVSRSRGAAVEVPIVAWQLSDLELLTGNWDEAMRLADEAIEGTRFRDGAFAVSMARAARARILALRGRLDEARADLDLALSCAGSIGGISLTATVMSGVLVERCADNHAGVHAIAGPMVDAARQGTAVDPSLLRFVPDEIEALIALDDITAAADVLDWFAARCASTGRRSGLAAVARCRAQIAVALEDPETGLGHAQMAAALSHDAGMPFDTGRALLLVGGIHRRTRHKRLAGDALLEASSIFDRLGAPMWLARAEQEFSHIGIRRSAGQDGSELTAVEADIAARVATGLTNREVAAEFFMSPKTVEHHLTRIYAKVGVRSRHELRSLFAGRGAV